ncbi:MAG TPA: HAD family hydrolase [Kiritimatiellia bacterium]|nr:HAD family hydrolase [Kiritimatiellia bacterium]
MHQPHPLRACLFDLDGTLLDTLRDLGESMNAVLAARDYPTHPIDAYRYFVGEGASLLVERSFPEDRRAPDDIRAGLAEYRAVYERCWNVHTRPYDGIPEMLDVLAARKLTLGILSNKPHRMTIRCVEGYLAAWPFACVLGQRDDVGRKPNPAGAFEAAHLMHVPPAEVLYLGDTATDMETARAAGMFAVGATWGFRPEAELCAAGAQAIVHNPREVVSLLAHP